MRNICDMTGVSAITTPTKPTKPIKPSFGAIFTDLFTLAAKYGWQVNIDMCYGGGNSGVDGHPWQHLKYQGVIQHLGSRRWKFTETTTGKKHSGTALIFKDEHIFSVNLAAEDLRGRQMQHIAKPVLHIFGIM